MSSRKKYISIANNIGIFLIAVGLIAFFMKHIWITLILLIISFPSIFFFNKWLYSLSYKIFFTKERQKEIMFNLEKNYSEVLISIRWHLWANPFKPRVVVYGVDIYFPDGSVKKWDFRTSTQPKENKSDLRPGRVTLHGYVSKSASHVLDNPMLGAYKIFIQSEEDVELKNIDHIQVNGWV